MAWPVHSRTVLQRYEATRQHIGTPAPHRQNPSNPPLGLNNLESFRRYFCSPPALQDILAPGVLLRTYVHGSAVLSILKLMNAGPAKLCRTLELPKPFEWLPVAYGMFAWRLRCRSTRPGSASCATWTLLRPRSYDKQEPCVTFLRNRRAWRNTVVMGQHCVTARWWSARS